ncbi:hypothetical protein ACA910_021888 [Epithemia clementina (nom. ined.)]
MLEASSTTAGGDVVANETSVTPIPSTDEELPTTTFGENPQRNPSNNNFKPKRRGDGRNNHAGSGSQRSFRSAGYKDIYGLNEALNRLAEEAGDTRHSVVRKAMAAEELWKEFNVAVEDDDDDEENSSASLERHKKTMRSDTVSFNTVLKAWGKATQVLAEHRGDRNHAHLLDPNIPIYTARECALHALELLNQQEKDALLGEKGNVDPQDSAAPDVHSFNTVLDAFAKSRTDEEGIRHVEDLLGRLQKSPTMQPDVISYNALVEVYGLSNRSDRLEKLRRIWKYMDETPALYPETRTTSSILHAYSGIIKEDPTKATELAKEAQVKFESLKQRFEETGHPQKEPDVMVYTNAMDVWSKVGTLDAAYQTEAIFRELKSKQSTNVDLRPSSYTYSTLITAWSRVANRREEATERVVEILDEMIGDKDLMALSNHPFTAAIKCWARSNTKGKAVRALNTLKQMKEISKYDRRAYPTIQTYHAALDCCSRPSVDGNLSEDTASLKIAFAILQAVLKDGLEPTQYTYAKLLRCVEMLLPSGSERSKVAEATFEKARAAGMADVSVVRSFKRAAGGTVIQKALSDISDRNGYVDFSKIPYAWMKNVKP